MSKTKSFWRVLWKILFGSAAIATITGTLLTMMKQNGNIDPLTVTTVTVPEPGRLLNNDAEQGIKEKPIKPKETLIPQIKEQLKGDTERQVQDELRKQKEVLTLEQHKQEEAKKLEEQRAAQEHENFLNRYLLNRSFQNRPESKEIAVILIDEGNGINQDITQKIAFPLKNEEQNVTASLFTTSFVSDGMFERIFQGDSGEVKRLELSNIKIS